GHRRAWHGEFAEGRQGRGLRPKMRAIAADKDVGWPTALMSPGVGLSAAPSSFTSLRRPPNVLVWRRWWRPIVEYGSSVSGAGRWGALRSEVKEEGAPAGRRRGT